MRSARAKRGGILLAVLGYILVTAVIMAGVLTLSVSHFSVASTDVAYDASLAAAEAGVNYEINKISLNPALADQKNSSGNPGTAYNVTDSSGNVTGTMTIYITQNNSGVEATPWSWPNPTYIYCTGVVNGVSRTIKCGAKVENGAGGIPHYALFSMTGGLFKGSAVVINGDVGTDGGPTAPASTYGAGFSTQANPTINGNVVFAGSGAGWSATPGNIYSVTYQSNPILYDTVSDIALEMFPSGGLTYLATHNDNALASPAITGNAVSMTGSNVENFVGKAGGANYYITSMSLKGSSSLSFNNTAGPINIWVGPNGGSGSVDVRGGLAAVEMSADPTKPVTMYCATTGGVSFSGNSETDMALFSYNGANSGPVNFNGSQTINGPIITDTFSFSGNPTINYISGFFTQVNPPYFGATAAWSEIGGAF